jgi:WD40 repeat protein
MCMILPVKLPCGAPNPELNPEASCPRARAQVQDLAFSPCGALVASCGKDTAIRLWDVGTGQALTPPALKLHGTHPGSFPPINVEFHVAVHLCSPLQNVCFLLKHCPCTVMACKFANNWSGPYTGRLPLRKQSPKPSRPSLCLA